ncbi:MAG: 3'-5' exonuclease [Verrucomicrobiota bacterium]|nr:3'-5' exonuclease [Verrucomicrobiota bacterium]
MFETPIHVIDFEGSRQSGVVEYGYVTLENGEIVDSQTRICAPVGTITDLDRSQHGISEGRASKHTFFELEWSLFARLRQSGAFCGHNALVEDGFIRAVWPCPRISPDFAEPGQVTATWGPWLDTLHIYRRVYPQLENHKLQALIEIFDLQAALDAQAATICPTERRRYHCALYDALASALLLRRLADEPTLKGASMHWLFVQSAASVAARNAMGQQELL